MKSMLSFRFSLYPPIQGGAMKKKKIHYMSSIARSYFFMLVMNQPAYWRVKSKPELLPCTDRQQRKEVLTRASYP